jgi:hypothetical protein
MKGMPGSYLNCWNCARHKMKEHPIIMSTEMVKSILEDRKTMTRRTMGLTQVNYFPDSWFGIPENIQSNLWKLFHKGGTTLIVKCPYGQVGDRLWLKETCKIQNFGDHKGLVAFKTTSNTDPSVATLKWIPSIFMPRWASRILLEITALRVERLKGISEEEAMAEGCSPKDTLAYRMSAYPSWNGKLRFKELWDSLNAKRGYGWDKNPWIWVISFRRLNNVIHTTESSTA